MKAQLFSADFILAMVFVIFILAIYIIISAQVVGTLGTQSLRADLSGAANSAASQLVEAPGSPSDWEYNATLNESLGSLGLASEPGVIDDSKAARFFNITQGRAEYNATKTLLGLNRHLYGWNASLSYLNSTLIYSVNASPSGLLNTFGATNMTAVVSRLVAYNGTAATLSLTVWQEG